MKALKILGRFGVALLLLAYRLTLGLPLKLFGLFLGARAIPTVVGWGIVAATFATGLCIWGGLFMGWLNLHWGFAFVATIFHLYGVAWGVPMTYQHPLVERVFGWAQQCLTHGWAGAGGDTAYPADPGDRLQPWRGER